jgi:hypothetical protein
MKASGIWRVPLTLGAITGSKQQYSKNLDRSHPVAEVVAKNN